MSETVTLWRPTGQRELDLVAQSGWKKWPPRLAGQPIFYPVLNRHYAERIAREWNVPGGGVGYVTTFEVRREYIERFEVHKVGDREALEYWIPAGDLDSFNSNIAGAIMTVAEFRAPVPASEFDSAEREMGRAFPEPWRDYLQRPSWVRNGWLSEECYVCLRRPAESAEMAAAWEPSTSLHPGIVFVGDDGSRVYLALDVRLPNPPVMAVQVVSPGWSDAVEQAGSLDEFVARVEDGSFRYRP